MDSALAIGLLYLVFLAMFPVAWVGFLLWELFFGDFNGSAATDPSGSEVGEG